jgi:hypothetical protein
MEHLDYMLFDGKRHQPLPRPSEFEVVTWQLNVTVYPPGDGLRWVSTLRDPQIPDAIHRAHVPLVRFREGERNVLEQCQETMRAIGYITGLSKGI